MSEDSDRATAPPTSQDRLSLFWRRLKEHRIAQWAVGYVAVAYAIQHGVTLTAEAFDWPHTVERVSMLLLALGLPVAMTLAWFHGERTMKRVSHGELSIVSLLLVAIAILFYVFVRPAGEDLRPVNGNSLAVLPFANLS